MVVEKDLKLLLESETLNYEDVIQFLKESKIFETKDWYKLFLIIVNVAYRNGYQDAIKFALESEKKLNAKVVDVDA